MSSVKLPASKVKAYREAMLTEQGGVCALTHYPLAAGDAVLDHCHKTGHIRGVIHRGVNSLLGKLENNAPRYGVSTPMMMAMGANLRDYLGQDHTVNPLHYTHRTEDEKRIRRNTQARKLRAAKKEATCKPSAATKPAPD